MKNEGLHNNILGLIFTTHDNDSQTKLKVITAEQTRHTSFLPTVSRHE